jgi:serine phosphatase RsbU (regulator of sigma subunit)
VVAPDLTIEYISAGHPPPLVVSDGGETRMLENSGGLPIGCRTGGGYHTQYAKLDPDETLILYTDGLVERRGESIDVGLQRLRDAAAEGPDDAEDLADHLIRTLLPLAGGEDDIALLTLRPAPVPASRAV